ncbi:MAM domain-containing glycosylphosphatidylinositol anchor protein 1-like protein, partial [Lates japonicus]
TAYSSPAEYRIGEQNLLHFMSSWIPGDPKTSLRITLKCTVDSKTAGSASDKFQETSIYNETLRIEGIQRVQGGRYYCKADNAIPTFKKTKAGRDGKIERVKDRLDG